MNLLTALKPGSLILVMDISSCLPALLAELVLHGPFTVLDAGNRFPAYRIVHEIRKRSTHIKEATDRLQFRRAFTAYQTLHLLESSPAVPHPHILLDLFTPLQDAQLHPREADRLLAHYLVQIERLSVRAPIVLSCNSFLREERTFLLQRLSNCADQILSLATSSNINPSQPLLFT